MAKEIDREDLIRFHSPDDYYEIGDDPDGLGCIEVRYFEYRDKKPVQTARMTFAPHMAEAIGAAMIELANKKQNESKSP